MTETQELQFPSNFLWGAATSPTQIEGNTKNEWAGFIARDGAVADDGCNHWEDYERDFTLLKDIGLNSYRLGLDWGRLQRAPGAPLCEESLTRYRQMLEWLRGNNIEPLVTLHHFANPAWLANSGGWANAHSIAYFSNFVSRLLDAGLPVKYWVTVNEPGVYLTMGYLIGLFPPKKHYAFYQGYKALKNLSLAHSAARAMIKDRNPEAMVGIAKHFKYFTPFRKWHFIDKVNAYLCKHLFTLRVLESFVYDRNGNIDCDFIGVNYYGRMRVRGFGDMSPVSGAPQDFFEKAGVSCDDMWEQDPQWMSRLLCSLTKRYGLPLYITESGFATEDEELRHRLLAEHLKSLEKAINKGADVRGFYYWTLTDNFEWAEGFTKKFGLAGIDFKSRDKKRVLRPVARYYSEVIRNSSAREGRYS